jgi:hypothetical protein
VLDERFEGAVDELLYDGLVEAAGEYDHPSSDAARRTMELSHLREAGGRETRLGSEQVSELCALGFQVA